MRWDTHVLFTRDFSDGRALGKRTQGGENTVFKMDWIPREKITGPKFMNFFQTQEARG